MLLTKEGMTLLKDDFNDWDESWQKTLNKDIFQHYSGMIRG